MTEVHAMQATNTDKPTTLFTSVLAFGLMSIVRFTAGGDLVSVTNTVVMLILLLNLKTRCLAKGGICIVTEDLYMVTRGTVHST